MSRYGSYDLMLASPPEELPETAPCRCGHTLEVHDSRQPYRCDLQLGFPARDAGGGVIEPAEYCDCRAFELDEE